MTISILVISGLVGWNVLERLSPEWSHSRLRHKVKLVFHARAYLLLATEAQEWLYWALVYNPSLGRHQVAKLNTQTFGSLGAVVAWYRTARAIQTVMAELGLLVFIYVDDCFWVTPKYASDTAPNATWVLRVFRVCHRSPTGVEAGSIEISGRNTYYINRPRSHYGQ